MRRHRGQMAVDGSSRLDELITAYGDNCGYDDGAGDVSEAREFKKVCRLLRLQLQEESSKGPTRIRSGINVQQLDKDLAAVTAWLAVNDSTYTQTRVARPDFRNFRG